MNFLGRPGSLGAPRWDHCLGDNRGMSAFVAGREKTDIRMIVNPKLPSLLSSLLFFPLDLTAVSHHNWCLKDIAKMSVSVSQLVSQGANNLLAIHAGFHRMPRFMPAYQGLFLWLGPQGGALAPHWLWGSGGGKHPSGTLTMSSEGGWDQGSFPGEPHPRNFRVWQPSVSPPPYPQLPSSHSKVRETSKGHINSYVDVPRCGGEAAKLCVSRFLM